MVDELEVDPGQEELRLRIDESREALAQKLEQLEDKVAETVETATASMADATVAVMETVQNATSSVTETVDSVTSAVQGTVDSVRQSVEGTVDSVKETFNLSRQVEQHPWLFFGGAVAVGYFGEQFLTARPGATVSSQFNGNSNGVGGYDYSSLSQPIASVPPEATSNRFHRNVSPRPVASPPTGPNWFSELSKAVAPELGKLQSLAVGAALSALRDVLKDVVPQPLQEPLSHVIDDLTEKAGGTPVQGPLLSSESSMRDQSAN